MKHWLLSLLMMSCAVVAVAEDTLQFAADTWPPFLEEKDATELKGIDYDVLKEMTKRAGLKLTHTFAPWKRAVYLVKQGEADIISHMSYRKDREEFVYFIKPAYFEKDHRCFFVKRGSDVVIKKFEDLSQYRIGVLRGAVYDEKFDAAIRANAIKVFEGNSLESTFQMLAAGRIDAVISHFAAGQIRIQRLGLTKQITTAEFKLTSDPNLYFALSLKSKLFDKRKALDAALKSMKDDGTLKKIEAKYFGEE